jgi:hypothetical protein
MPTLGRMRMYDYFAISGALLLIAAVVLAIRSAARFIRGSSCKRDLITAAGCGIGFLFLVRIGPPELTPASERHLQELREPLVAAVIA